MYMCVCVCIHTYTYIDVHTHTHTRTHTHTHNNSTPQPILYRLCTVKPTSYINSCGQPSYCTYPHGFFLFFC